MSERKYEREFGDFDREYLQLMRETRKEQLRKLAIELSLEIDSEYWLRSVVIFMATMQGKKLKDERDNYSLVLEGGAA